jgi:hypothetical protein
MHLLIIGCVHPQNEIPEVNNGNRNKTKSFSCLKEILPTVRSEGL